MNDTWYVLNINPDPWAIGPLGVGKRNGKFFPYVGRNTQLAAYKEAVRDLMTVYRPLDPGEYTLTFYFWRRLDSHASGKKHIADATNLQKATEDALQGILFDNDRDVHDVRSVVVEQGSDVRPLVIVRASLWSGLDPNEIPTEIWEQVDKVEQPTLFEDRNTWNGPQ